MKQYILYNAEKPTERLGMTFTDENNNETKPSENDWENICEAQYHKSHKRITKINVKLNNKIIYSWEAKDESKMY